MITEPGSPVDRLLTGSMFVVPLVYLLADVLYAVNGWDDPSAAVFHIIGATFYLLVLLRVITWASPGMSAGLLVVTALGVAGNVAYGFNTIHVSLGDTDLVDATGAAVIIKPLGLFFPLALLLSAVVLKSRPIAAGLVGVASLAWPVAHIANIGWLAVVVNVALVAGFGAAARRETSATSAPSPVRT